MATSLHNVSSFIDTVTYLEASTATHATFELIKSKYVDRAVSRLRPGH